MLDDFKQQLPSGDRAKRATIMTFAALVLAALLVLLKVVSARYFLMLGPDLGATSTEPLGMIALVLDIERILRYLLVPAVLAAFITFVMWLTKHHTSA